MTDAEKRAQKAELLLQHYEASDNLTAWQEHARQLHEALLEIASWLEAMANMGSHEDDPAAQQLDLSNPKFRDALTFEKVRETGDAIRASMARVRELERRRMASGLGWRGISELPGPSR